MDEICIPKAVKSITVLDGEGGSTIYKRRKKRSKSRNIGKLLMGMVRRRMKEPQRMMEEFRQVTKSGMGRAPGMKGMSKSINRAGKRMRRAARRMMP